MNPEISKQAYSVFQNNLIQIPSMTLRSGNAVDSYYLPIPYDEQLDKLNDEYIEKYAYFALPHLDPTSWLYYLPYLIDFSLRHATAEATNKSSLVLEGVLFSLRPPDREPPRLSVLTAEQESVIGQFLDLLAFDDQSDHQDFAMQVIEEYWMPGALYRDL